MSRKKFIYSQAVIIIFGMTCLGAEYFIDNFTLLENQLTSIEMYRYGWFEGFVITMIAVVFFFLALDFFDYLFKKFRKKVEV